MPEDSTGDEGLDRLHEELECPVCVRLFYDPVTTPCGHSLCRRCLRAVLDRDHPKCPLCRTIFHTGMRDTPVSNVLQRVIQQLYADEYRAIGEEEATIHQASTDDGPRDIPLFVMAPLLPFEKMQLNIFEPRYRLLIRRAMESNRRFGIAGHIGSGLMPVITEVILERCDVTPDGRFLIAVQGLSRHSYERISNQDGYAVAVNCTPYEDDEPTDEDRAMIEAWMKTLHGDEHADSETERRGIVDKFYDPRQRGVMDHVFAGRPARDDVVKTAWLAGVTLALGLEHDGCMETKMQMLMSKRVAERLALPPEKPPNCRTM